MINTQKQAIFTIIILIGAGLLIFTLVSEADHLYLKITGLILLMLGLYNSTKQWARDNPKDNTEDNLDESENELNTPKIDEDFDQSSTKKD